MNEATVTVIKAALHRDFIKDARKVKFHEAQMTAASCTPEYRRAVMEAVAEWNAAGKERGSGLH